MALKKTEEEKDIQKMAIVLFWPIWLPIVVGFFWIVYWIVFRCKICRG